MLVSYSNQSHMFLNMRLIQYQHPALSSIFPVLPALTGGGGGCCHVRWWSADKAVLCCQKDGLCQCGVHGDRTRLEMEALRTERRRSCYALTSRAYDEEAEHSQLTGRFEEKSYFPPGWVTHWPEKGRDWAGMLFYRTQQRDCGKPLEDTREERRHTRGNEYLKQRQTFMICWQKLEFR